MANPGNRGGFSYPEQQRGTEPGRTAEQTAQGVMGGIKEKASDIASGVASAAETAWDATRSAAQNVGAVAEDAWGSVSGFMKDYPIATFCIGAGVGFLLAQLLTSRRA